MKKKINHLHFYEIDSTQEFLKKLLVEEKPDINGKRCKDNILVSTSSQNSGRGQFSRRWDYYPGSLAFSFTIAPGEIIEMTSLEIGVLLLEFLKRYFSLTNLYLKWPNDILNESGQKCAGILINVINEKLLVVGVGINLICPKNLGSLNPMNVNDFHRNLHAYKIPIGFIFDDKEQFLSSMLSSTPEEFNLCEQYKNFIPKLFFSFVLANRMKSSQIISDWERRCCHLNKPVLILDSIDDIGVEKKQKQRIFEKLGPRGEAVIDGKHYFSASILGIPTSEIGYIQ